MIFASKNKNKEALEKYTELWNEIKNEIETISGGEPITYKKDFMKITFESDEDLPLGKILNIPILTIVTRTVFQEDNKYYPQVYFHECLYKFVQKLQKCYNMKELMVQKELTQNKSNKSKGCMTCHYWYFRDNGYKFEPHVSSKCKDISMMAYELENR